MKKVALFFGSFNPIHYGHLSIAKCILQRKYVDEVWLVVSPLNPMKNSVSIDKEQRAKLIEDGLSAESLDEQVKVSRVEFNMPIPSYTIDTLMKLHSDYTNIEFSLVIGEDNLRAFHKWKSYKDIAKMLKIYVYPRKGNDYEGLFNIEIDLSQFKNIEYLSDVDLLEISSTTIRESEKHFEEGIGYQRRGELHKALNAFINAQKGLPNNKELNTRIEMIKNIFDYSYKEFLNA